jgi:zinc protease
MKKILYFLLVAFVMTQCTPTTSDNTSNSDMGSIKVGQSPDTDLDRSQAPKPGPAPKIQMGTYESFTLDNGLECIVVKNNKLPRVSFQYTLNIDPIMEGDKAGMQDMVGEMLSRGTKNRTKEQFDEEVDFIGGTLSTYSSGVYASSLTKHSDKIIELMADVLLNPTFPKEELEKVKTQTLSGLASAKNEPNAIASNVVDVLNYGKNHPYGELMTEETVGNITAKDIKEYYYNNFNPNAGYLVIVGDIDAKAAKAKMQKYFDQWKKGTTAKRSYDLPKAPQATTVAMVDRSGSVQSVIKVTYPVDLKPGADDLIAASVANAVLGGGGFAGRLMQNLREDKGFTYGSGSSLSYDPLVGVFSASASVRNEVTDSAVTEILYEIGRLSTEKVAPEDLQKIKNIMAGRFARSLERPQTVANFALNIARYDLPADYYEKYLERLDAVTAEDVMRVSKKYLTANNANILIVGDKDAVAKSLEKFDAKKQVNFYDNYGNPVVQSDKKVEVTGEQVIEKYIEAIGGRTALMNVKDIQKSAEMLMQGQKLSLVTMQKAPNKYKESMTMQGMVVQQQTFDGTKGAVSGMQGSKSLEGEELKALAEQAVLFSELTYGKTGYKLEVKGIENINDSDAYKVKITSPSGEKLTQYFDVKSGLKVRTVSTQGEATVTIDSGDYKEVGGIMFPHTSKIAAGPQNIEAKTTEIKINSGIADDTFKVD